MRCPEGPTHYGSDHLKRSFKVDWIGLAYRTLVIILS